jgi:sugar phosphate isomerase/epimerase
VGAASWEAFLPAPAPGALANAPAWSRATAAGVLASLARLRCPLLILPVGADQQSDAAARGERLLGRVRAGELLHGDEALEELNLLLEPRAERQLEELAALVHDLLRRAPGLRIALAPGPSPAALLTPARARLLLAELRRPGLGLWHDPADAEARAAAGLPPAGAWLDTFGARVFGVSLHDWSRGQAWLPPGAGAVDWTLLAEYLPRDAERVLHLAPSTPEGLLHEARAWLADRLPR